MKVKSAMEAGLILKSDDLIHGVASVFSARMRFLATTTGHERGFERSACEYRSSGRDRAFRFSVELRLPQ
jgi:hypothetical protein